MRALGPDGAGLFSLAGRGVRIEQLKTAIKFSQPVINGRHDAKVNDYQGKSMFYAADPSVTDARQRLANGGQTVPMGGISGEGSRERSPSAS